MALLSQEKQQLLIYPLLTTFYAAVTVLQRGENSYDASSDCVIDSITLFFPRQCCNEAVRPVSVVGGGWGPQCSVTRLVLPRAMSGGNGGRNTDIAAISAAGL